VPYRSSALCTVQNALLEISNLTWLIVFVLTGIKCRIGAQPRCDFGRMLGSLLLRSVLENRKQHAINFDQLQSRAI
jgi:hypothetical protein